MTQFSTFPGEPFSSFERGINRDSPVTVTDQGYYYAAKNMLLSSDTSARHPASCKLDSKLDPEKTWETGNVIWFSPFTYSDFDADTGELSFATHLLIHRSDGSYWRWDAPDASAGELYGTTTLVRRQDPDVGGDQLISHFIYDQWLCTLDGVNAPMKYGQHFRWDGIAIDAPCMFPIGSKPISILDSGISGETVSLGGSSAWVADANLLDGGARVGIEALQVDLSQAVTITFGAVRNFLTGPSPYGGTDFAATDSIAFQYLKTEGSGDVVIRMGNAADTAYYQWTVTGLVADGTWHTATALRSAATTAGVPSYATSIIKVTITNSDASADIFIDDLYFLYSNAPPSASVGTAHKDRIVLGGVPITGTDDEPSLSTLFYSTVNKPDEFPSTNQQIISGGSTSLARVNRITALREYGDAVIIGTPGSIFSWTIGSSGDPSRSVITSETGIDSPRAIVETPAGSLLFPWQRGFYILRQTGRAYVSEKIAPILKDIWLEEPWWTIGVRDDRTKTIRFWFREKPSGEDNPTVVSQGVIFDYVRAQEIGEAVWVSTMTQMADFAVEAYVDGLRETLYCRFDGQDIWRMHVQEGGQLESSITFPWMAVGGKDRLAKWLGLTVPYASTSIIRTFIRYANNPGEFETAAFVEVDSLPPSPNLSVQGRVNFGRTSRWAQVKLQSQMYGFEVFPPVEFVQAPTSRTP